MRWRYRRTDSALRTLRSSSAEVRTRTTARREPLAAARTPATAVASAYLQGAGLWLGPRTPTTASKKLGLGPSTFTVSKRTFQASRSGTCLGIGQTTSSRSDLLMRVLHW